MSAFTSGIVRGVARTGAKLAMSALAAAGILLHAGDASAIELGTPAQEHPFRSAQNFALELRFSPYYPAVDEEPGLSGTPFKDRFGDSARLYFGLEFDWQTFRIPYLGTIGPGIGAGIVGMSRPAVTRDSRRPSGDDYSLSIYPMYLSGVLRADVLWRELGIPVVPYGKFGVGMGLWEASNSGGTSKSTLAGESKPVAGKGMTLGTHAALGLAFALDAIDSGASRNMDNAIGVNNTYVYAEYYWLSLNGIGQDRPLYVGTNTWAAGLAFEF
ncbi:MAG: hypothetical protein BGO98_00845 [Myxococcales bacterium 68-20]|nr:hypothetical protein [Myxococcales bacterium]OJY17478.1 MAG: hypothetical protein BGO98_00845 [Myxococcales bacterium 68-20]